MAHDPMQEIYAVVADEFEALNQTIIEQLRSEVGLVEEIGHYIIDSGGKRLRPLITLLGAQACQYSNSDHINLAAIIEFIHTATLLHDDVVDMSEMRRGKFTANAKFGNAPSVLVGDFLYSRSFQMMNALDNKRIMKVLSDATNLIAEGEVMQLINATNPNVSEEEYFNVIIYKTATLFQVATQCSAILANANQAHEVALSQYGLNLGIAFQLIDDLLDYQGNPDELGKNVGDDLSEGKPTLPLIYAMNHGSPKQAALIRKAIEEKQVDKLSEIISIVQDTGGIDYTYQKAVEASQLATTHLAVLTESAEKKALIRLANIAVNRSF